MEKHILKHLDNLAKESKQAGLYAIEYKGVRLKMTSGKTTWETIAAAKNAIRYQLPSFRIECPDTWRTRLEVIKDLETREIIKYVKL